MGRRRLLTEPDSGPYINMEEQQEGPVDTYNPQPEKKLPRIFLTSTTELDSDCDTCDYDAKDRWMDESKEAILRANAVGDGANEVIGPEREKAYVPDHKRGQHLSKIKEHDAIDFDTDLACTVDMVTDTLCFFGIKPPTNAFLRRLPQKYLVRLLDVIPDCHGEEFPKIKAQEEINEIQWPGFTNSDPSINESKLMDMVKKERKSRHTQEEIDLTEKGAKPRRRLTILDAPDDTSTDVKQTGKLKYPNNLRDALVLHRMRLNPGTPRKSMAETLKKRAIDSQRGPVKTPNLGSKVLRENSAPTLKSKYISESVSLAFEKLRLESEGLIPAEVDAEEIERRKASLYNRTQLGSDEFRRQKEKELEYIRELKQNKSIAHQNFVEMQKNVTKIYQEMWEKNGPPKREDRQELGIEELGVQARHTKLEQDALFDNLNFMGTSQEAATKALEDIEKNKESKEEQHSEEEEIPFASATDFIDPPPPGFAFRLERWEEVFTYLDHWLCERTIYYLAGKRDSHSIMEMGDELDLRDWLLGIIEAEVLRHWPIVAERIGVTNSTIIEDTSESLRETIRSFQVRPDETDAPALDQGQWRLVTLALAKSQSFKRVESLKKAFDTSNTRVRKVFLEILSEYDFTMEEFEELYTLF